MRPWLAPPWQMWGAHRSSAGEAAIDRSFRRPEAAYLHARYARRGRSPAASIGSEAPPPTGGAAEMLPVPAAEAAARRTSGHSQTPKRQTRRSFLRRVRPPISRAAERDFHLSASFSRPEGCRIELRRARHSRILSSKARAIGKQCCAAATCALLVGVSRVLLPRGHPGAWAGTDERRRLRRAGGWPPPACRARSPPRR